MADTTPISTRIPESFNARLREAAGRSQQSVSQLLRQIVIDYLEGVRSAENAPDSTTKQITKLREDLATTVAAMLVLYAKQTPASAESWVREHLAP